VTTSALDVEAESSDEHALPPPTATIKNKTVKARRYNLMRRDVGTSVVKALWSVLIGCSSFDGWYRFLG